MSEQKLLRVDNLIYQLDGIPQKGCPDGVNLFTIQVKGGNRLMSKDEVDALTDKVFRAVNSHDALVEVARGYISFIQLLQDWSVLSDSHEANLKQRLTAAKAALALAEGN